MEETRAPTELECKERPCLQMDTKPYDVRGSQFQERWSLQNTPAKLSWHMSLAFTKTYVFKSFKTNCHSTALKVSQSIRSNGLQIGDSDCRGWAKDVFQPHGFKLWPLESKDDHPSEPDKHTPKSGETEEYAISRTCILHFCFGSTSFMQIYKVNQCNLNVRAFFFIIILLCAMPHNIGNHCFSSVCGP